MPRNTVHPVRVQARLMPDNLESVQRVAEIQGLSIGDFVVAIAAKDAAH